MFAPTRHVLPMTLIRRRRMLPAAGKVLVRHGQKLGALDTVAEAGLAPEFVLIDTGRGLGLAPNKTERYIQCQVGNRIAAGDVIAGPVGFGRRVVRAPKDGRVVLVGPGQVLIEISEKPFELKAGIPGDVVELIPDYGAVLETGGALIQGVWGNGRIEYGALRVLAKAPDAETHSADIDVSLRGAVVLAGCCADEEVLRTGAELPVRGLVFSGLEARLASVAAQLPIPVMVLEGFGRRAHHPAALKLLESHDGRSVAINTEMDAAGSQRLPEIVIPLPTPGNVALPPDVIPLEPGCTVRMIRRPAAGEIGHVIALRGKVALPNGVRTHAAEVRLENGQTILIPLVNLEVMA